MENMTLEQIAQACGGIYYGDEEKKKLEVAGVVIDSRQVKKDYLFIPIRGEKVDGHSFIPQVFADGAAAVLSEEKLEHPDGPYILVEKCIPAMKKLAEYYRKSLEIPVVGITGSVGKTSTKEMISSVLSKKYLVHKTEGNFNNGIGLPLTIFQIRKEHQVAVLEMGISEFGEMDELATMANPDICVITNIGYCHLENLKTRDGILQAKTECFAHMKPDGIAILNGDDDKLSTIQEVNGKQPVFYGLGAEAAEGCQTTKSVYATNIVSLGLEGTRAQIHIGDMYFEVHIPIPGEHNVYNALAATAVGVRLGLTPQQICAGIESTGTISGRTNMIHAGDLLVIDDCYNANPVSMKASLDVLSQAEGRKIAVLGDMGELGDKEKELHYEVGEHLAGKKIDVLFTAGTLAKEIARGVREHQGSCKLHEFADRVQMTEALKDFVQPGDTILVKASHFMEFPKVVAALTGK
ncbi:MAG: UDP-N-acetylmuramoyl-tripeptide--D-alanyl-D-alanine ligase [Lachnospiraceae bacterium]|nr:UDP-N-acetylmuramoyl-tripeptide--D-alanyl-D-alanine ligase [Lachnospiraceae bacterium]